VSVLQAMASVNAESAEQPALLRRCIGLQVSPAEPDGFELAGLMGSSPLKQVMSFGLLARAPHLRDPTRIDLQDLATLLTFSETLWQEMPDWSSNPRLQRLIGLGLLVAYASECEIAECERLARQSFWDAGALNQLQASRWNDKDYAHPKTREWQDIRDIVARFGPPPEHQRPQRPVTLPVPAPLPHLRSLVEKRRTARNFDALRPLRLDELSALLWAGAGELGREPMAEGADAVRRPVPSGGALHPLELFVLAQRVEGLNEGIYRYASREGQLDAVLDEEQLPDRFAYRALAGQTWFSNAPALIFICCNFARHLHKYRQHPKALRVLHVEVGHVAQNLYLAAAELHLGCFITLAINERLADDCLQLDGIRGGVLAVAGAGRNTDRGPVPELWP
jgi:putative peptide maturation dehydrogenase